MRLQLGMAAACCLASAACGEPSVGVSSTNVNEQPASECRDVGAMNASLSETVQAEKYAKMAQSSFTFYRGTNHLFWADLGSDARLSQFGGDDATAIWLQGDLHINNFGSFHDDDGRIVYDLNDFDESFVGDYQLDVWRTAVSLVSEARAGGFADHDAHDFVDAFAESYLDALDDYRGNDAEDDFAVTKDNAYGRLDDFLEDVEQGESRRKMLDKWTTGSDSEQTLDTSVEKLVAVDDGSRAALAAALAAHGDSLSGGLDYSASYYAVKGVAQRLKAGIGSYGTPRFYVLIEGPSASGDDDIILDIKRASMPTGMRCSEPATSIWSDTQALRSVTAQKALGTNVDDHLGWLELADESYTVRERSPYKETFEAAEELTSPTRFTKLAKQWGAILAADHARADRDFDQEHVAFDFEEEVHARTDGDHKKFRALLWEVADGYADKVDHDYQVFLANLP